MRFLDRHPSSDALSDFASAFAHSGDPSDSNDSCDPADSGNASEPQRARVARHLEGCAPCRERVQWILTASRALGPGGAGDAAAPPDGLRARVLASRAAGARGILPVGPQASPRRSGLTRWAASAAALLVIALGYAWSGTSEAEAGATAGELHFSPALPRTGDRVRVTYAPVATLGGEQRLVLRARLRTSADESYNVGIKVHSLTALTRGRSGDFTGEFTLPPGVVFGAFVVEDDQAERVDDNDGRAWELFTGDGSGDGNGEPSFDALDQRAHDLMGRNWEEGHATVRRLVQLHPDDVRAWGWLDAFESWLGLSGVDSVRSKHAERLGFFHAKWRDVRPMDPELVGRMFWYSRTRDSTVHAFWKERLLSEAPRASFAIQERIGVLHQAFAVDKDTLRLFARFDTLFGESTPDRRIQVAGMAFNAAEAARDTARVRLWSDRIIASALDPVAQERSMAQYLAMIDGFRAEGIARTRRAIARLDSIPDYTRPLGETRQERQRTVDRLRRRAMSSLGRALVADGRAREGLEVLAVAAEEGWDLSVLRAAREASLTAGDTAGAMVFAARIAKDPRTVSGAQVADRALATKAIGAPAWEAALAEAEQAFAERMLTHAPMTALRGRGRVRDLAGKATDIATLAEGEVTVVAIWSRSCGPAVDELPNLGRVAARLAKAGVRVIGVVEERTLTPALQAFLAEKQVVMPTYLDAFGEVSKAFNSWGTPAYYVLDARGRVRFGGTSDAEELLARAEAVRLEGGR